MNVYKIYFGPCSLPKALLGNLASQNLSLSFVTLPNGASASVELLGKTLLRLAKSNKFIGHENSPVQ